jgi:hypothetical protein
MFETKESDFYESRNQCNSESNFLKNIFKISSLRTIFGYFLLLRKLFGNLVSKAAHI